MPSIATFALTATLLILNHDHDVAAFTATAAHASSQPHSAFAHCGGPSSLSLVCTLVLPSLLQLSSSSSDTITSSSKNNEFNNNNSNNNSNNKKSSAQEVAQQLRERAQALRREALLEEQTLRNVAQNKKEAEKKEADGWIDILLGYSSLSGNDDGDGDGDNGTTTVSPSLSIIPSSQTLALRIQENQLYSPSKLNKIVKRLHDRETTMMMGPEALLSSPDTTMTAVAADDAAASTSSTGDASSSTGGGFVVGGGFVLGDYENNSMERKQEESNKISGLLDRVLEAVQILEQKEEQGTTTLGTSRLATRLKVRVADLRLSREETLKRRVDSLLLSSNKNNNKNPKGENGSVDKNKRSSSSSSSKNNESINDFVRSSIQGDDKDNNDDQQHKSDKRKKQEQMMKRLIETPPWLPYSLSPFAATSPMEVSLSHWKMIKTELLQDSGFLCTSWDSTDVAAVFRGRLPRNAASYTPNFERGNDINANSDNARNDTITSVFNNLLARLEDHPDLGTRVQLFLVDDNEWVPSFDTAGQYGRSGGGWDGATEKKRAPPVIVALAKEVVPEQESERGLGTKSLAAFSTMMTLFTTLAYALSSFALNPTFFNAVVKENDITPVPLCLPVFFGVLAISALHEAGHFVAAKKNNVKLGTPVPLPSLQVGSFGSITPMRSFPPTRSALFDVAISGPGISMFVSLLLIVSGLSLTIGSESFATFPVVPAAIMRSSFLIGSIASVIAPKVMLVPLSQPIPIHPFFMVGLAGLVMSAVNLLPIGRLDGGRACMASWGRRTASLISFLSLAFMAVSSFSGLSGIIIFWGAIVVATQRMPDIPATDEVTGVGAIREYGYAVLLTLALLTLAPFPGGISPL